MPLNSTLVGLVYAAHQPQQGGLPGAVDTDQAHAELGRNCEANTLQHPFTRAVIGLITLVDVVNNNHWVTSLAANQVRPISRKEIAHVRLVAA